MNKRPTLPVAFATALKIRAESKGLLAYVPFVLGACLAVGFASASYIPLEFWMDSKWDVSTAVFGGLMAFNGLLMSLGWFAFSKIYEILANDSLGKMLTKYGLLGLHLSFIDITHFVLICASLLSVLGLIATLAGLPIVVDRLLFGGSLGLTLYGLSCAFSATRMMNDLIWEQANIGREPPKLGTVGGNGKPKSGT